MFPECPPSLFSSSSSVSLRVLIGRVRGGVVTMGKRAKRVCLRPLGGVMRAGFPEGFANSSVKKSNLRATVANFS